MASTRRARAPHADDSPVGESDLYALLGVRPDADAETIQAAYRRRARELHPDVNRAADATARFAAVQRAYEVLSDPEARRRYDEQDDRQPEPPSAAAPARPTYAWEGIGTPRANGRRPGPDAHDPTGFEELYQAFFAPRAGRGGPTR